MKESKSTIEQLLSLLEDREDYIIQHMDKKIERALQNDQSAQRYGIHNASELVDHFKKTVPPKTLQWVIRQYAKGNIKSEDSTIVANALKTFRKNLRKLDKKDINQYKTPGELYSTIEELDHADSDEDDHLTKSDVKEIKRKEVKTIIRTPDFKVFQPLTHRASCYYGANTQWCTTTRDDPDTFNSYHDQGPLYIIIVKTPDGTYRKFQLHYESGQLMDEHDENISQNDIDFLSNYPEWAEFLNILIDEHYSPLLEDELNAMKESFIDFLIRKNNESI